MPKQQRRRKERHIVYVRIQFMPVELIERLRAAHALAFALTARQEPDPGAFKAIGMGECDQATLALRFTDRSGGLTAMPDLPFIRRQGPER